MSMPTG
jgi:hypothetical protein